MLLDPHRHLGGCITTDFVWRVIQRRNWYHLALNHSEVKAKMQFTPGEPYSFLGFLDKFRILDRMIWDKQLIAESIEDIAQAIEAEGIAYTWLRFSVNKYLKDINWTPAQAIEFIYNEFERCCPGKVGLVLALKYESDRKAQTDYAKLICSPGIEQMVVGLDLVGDEAYFDADFYQHLFQDWQQYDKMLCAHVGESQSADNVAEAIKFGVNRVAHGIKAVDRPDILQLAKDNGIGFDMALSSNYLTGVWDKNTIHPIKAFIEAGVEVTIGTDDPIQCDTTLAKELELLVTQGLTEEQLTDVMKNAYLGAKRFNHI